MKTSILAFAAIAAGILAGCATVTRGTSNQIQIRSEPAGAQVTTSLSHNCMTPCTINVGRKDEFSVSIALPGFRTEKIEVGTRLAGAGAAGFAGNVIVGGVIGMGVDAVTGSTLEHYPNPIVVTLQRDAAPSPAPGTA
jgi:anaerobic selenocysteine-containing dehydrogenase